MLFAPEVGWPVAIALGAIVSPPDAIAATSIARRLNLPRRLVIIFEGESLVNDATALTIYRLAVAAAVATPARQRSTSHPRPPASWWSRSAARSSAWSSAGSAPGCYP